MGQFSMVHILILLVIVLVFFGPSRLPQMGSSLGKAIRDFKKGLDGGSPEDDATEEEKEKLLLARLEAKHGKSRAEKVTVDPSDKKDS